MQTQFGFTRTTTIRPPASNQALSRKPSSASLQSRPDVGKSRSELIAEAAYVRAEQRGFAPGAKWLHWLDAERDLGPARTD
jgi:hypothetical protein